MSDGGFCHYCGRAKCTCGKKRLIFLDVDGVLITGRLGWRTPSPECVQALNDLVARTGADIVVSSCWRVGRAVIELRELLASWGIKGKVVDKTPHARFDAVRGDEINEFLLTNSRYSDAAFVIIDDDKDMANLMSKLVRTSHEVGLTPNNVEQAIKVLESQ